MKKGVAVVAVWLFVDLLPLGLPATRESGMEFRVISCHFVDNLFFREIKRSTNSYETTRITPDVQSKANCTVSHLFARTVYGLSKGN